MAELKKASTNITRYIMIVDDSSGAPETGVTITDLDLQYTRYGVSPASKVDATALAAINSVHGDNKMFEVDGTSSPGLYRVDWPDAAFATGVDGVILVVSGSGFAPATEDITLVDNVIGDAIDSNNRVDVGSWIGTAVLLSNNLPSVEVAAVSGGFGTSSPDRLIDHLRAVMSKTATAPSTGVGTYDPSTDSMEILGEGQVAIKGAGFATSTDSLTEIRDAIDTLVAPSVVSSSALSGSGFLSDCVSLIRKAVDEPSTTPKYTDSDIVELLQAAFDTVLTDIHVTTDHPIMIRHSITLVDGEQDYVLPPGVSELIRVAEIDSVTNLPKWESWPGSYHDPSGHGWKLEGNVLRLLRDWNSTDTLELLYMPNAEPLFHKASLATPTTDLDNSALTMILNATVTDGTLDNREHAYVGYMIRILSSNANTQEERLIIGYDANTRTATFNKEFTRTHEGASAVTYEIVPFFGRLVKHVVCLRTSIDILSQEGNAKRMQTLTSNYQIKLAAMRRAISKKEGRFPHHFDGDTGDNSDRGSSFGDML